MVTCSCSGCRGIEEAEHFFPSGVARGTVLLGRSPLPASNEPMYINIQLAAMAVLVLPSNRRWESYFAVRLVFLINIS